MAYVSKRTALVFSADDEASLEKAISDALSTCVEVNMGIRRCNAFPAVNNNCFLCELTTKEVKNIIKKLTTLVKGRVFVEHAMIHLMYIPTILESTHAVADLKLKHLETGDELYGGTIVNLNEAFILSLSWPRSLFAEDVENRKGLYLGGNISCASSVPPGAKIGMWYPLWTERLSSKQLYQQTVAIKNSKAIQTFAKTMIRSDKELRSLLKSRVSLETASKTFEKPVLCSDHVSLMEPTAEGVDFTVNKFNEEPSEDSKPTNASDVLVTKRSTTSRSDLLGEQSDRV